MPLSDPHMLDRRDDALATIHAALDAGVTLLDTANIYAPSWDAMGHNEELTAQALRSWAASSQDRDRVLVTTKGGITRSAGEGWGRDGSADGLRRACEASLRALGTDVIDLYQLHRFDPDLPVSAQIEALAQLQSEGLVRMIGVSNVVGAELALAFDVAGRPGPPGSTQAGQGIVSVQNEFSPRFRGETDVMQTCAEAGVAFLPWSPLGGSAGAADIGSRFAVLAEIAAERGVSAQQVVLAWLLGRSPTVIPIPGSTRAENVRRSVAALEIQLSDDEMARIEASPAEAVSTNPDEFPRPPLR